VDAGLYATELIGPGGCRLQRLTQQMIMARCRTRFRGRRDCGLRASGLLKVVVRPLWLPDRNPNVAGHQVKVFIAVKKAARVAQGNRGDEMIRRRDGQPLAPCELSDTPISKPMP